MSGDANQNDLIDLGDLGFFDNDYSNYKSDLGWVMELNGESLVDSGDFGLSDNNYSSYISVIKHTDASTIHV